MIKNYNIHELVTIARHIDWEMVNRRKEVNLKSYGMSPQNIIVNICGYAKFQADKQLEAL